MTDGPTHGRIVREGGLYVDLTGAEHPEVLRYEDKMVGQGSSAPISVTSTICIWRVIDQEPLGRRPLLCMLTILQAPPTFLSTLVATPIRSATSPFLGSMR